LLHIALPVSYTCCVIVCEVYRATHL